MKMNKVVLLFLSLILTFSSFSLFEPKVKAKESLTAITKSAEITLSTTDPNTYSAKRLRLPNAVTTRLIPSDTGLTVKVNNIGTDTVDSVTVKIKSPKIYKKGVKGSNVKTVTFTKVPPAITKTKKMNIPMVRTKMTYKGSVIIKDAGKIDYKTAYASRKYPSDQLSKEWSKGTFETVAKSVDYHFGEHYKDKYIKASNLGQYLRMSANDRKAMKNISKTQKGKYTVRIKDDSKKVKNQKTKRYILINKSSKKLYSYGGR